jgi:predicted alpha/beta superfamily hydrolase
MRLLRFGRWLAALVALACAVPLIFAQTAASSACVPTVVGKLETFELPSKVFDYTRRARVWLPPGYGDAANRDRRYPVLYMFDGQNLFDACLAYDHVHEWQVDETVTRLVGEGKIEPLIVVGLDNALGRRAYEYLPWTDGIQDPSLTITGGTRLPEFLIKDVMPVIEAKYRVAKGRENTGIGGSSYGGIAALYVGVSAPLVFGKILAESPIMHVGNAEIVRYTAPLPAGPIKVFMGYGGRETDSAEATAAELKAIRMVESNLKNALVSTPEVRVVYDPQAHHNEEAWAKRLPEALEFLFPAPK